MDEIKARESIKDIKLLDKANVAGERMKRAFIRSKGAAENLMDDGQISPSEYAEDKIRYAACDATGEVGHTVKKEINKEVDRGRKVFKEYRKEQKNEGQMQKTNEVGQHFANETQRSVYENGVRMRRETQARNDTIKTVERSERTIKQSARSAGKSTIKTADASVKATEKTIKTAEATSKAAVKTAEATAKATEKAAQAAAKAAQKTAEAARQAAIAAYKAAVAVGKAIASAVKAIIAAVKELIAAIAAGGWVSVVVIVLICLIALIVCSSLGIFFYNENKTNERTMQEIVYEVNADYLGRLEILKTGGNYDEVVITGTRPSWPEVLSVYAVSSTTDPDDPMDVVSISVDRKQRIFDVFWSMTAISSRTEMIAETTIIETDDGNGNTVEEEVTVQKTVLYIVITSISADEMAERLGFSADQKAQLKELLAEDKAALWRALIGNVYSGTAPNEAYVWDVLYAGIGNPYGVAGLMGNLFAESGIRPDNLQNSYEGILGYSDETYTDAVDSGTYRSFGSDSAGYGLAQWTSSGRKQNLLSYANSMGVSISDLDMQLSFLLQEMKSGYSSVYTALQNATSVREASNAVLFHFESPADQGAAVQDTRAGYGMGFYEKFAIGLTAGR